MAVRQLQLKKNSMLNAICKAFNLSACSSAVAWEEFFFALSTLQRVFSHSLERILSRVRTLEAIPIVFEL
jgi:hypothetical protein